MHIFLSLVVSAKNLQCEKSAFHVQRVFQLKQNTANQLRCFVMWMLTGDGWLQMKYIDLSRIYYIFITQQMRGGDCSTQRAMSHTVKPSHSTSFVVLHTTVNKYNGTAYIQTHTEFLLGLIVYDTAFVCIGSPLCA